jgi:putative PIN family toxin of toxin-antitoxin system
MKIVLDTNVLVSALLSPQGIPAKVWSFVLEGKLTMIYDNYLFLEYVDVLNRKKLNIDTELLSIVFDFIKHEGEFGHEELCTIAFTDEKDRPIYELYKGSRADYLITGNIKHFPVDEHIVTPRNFLESVSLLPW